MISTTTQLENYLLSVPQNIKSLSNMEFKPIQTKWSKKEILGHLCDSANINHQRFVDILTTTTGSVSINNYNQDLLVKVHDYQHSFKTGDLIIVWVGLNTQIVNLLKHVPKQQWELPCILENKQRVTLEWLVNDYINHLNHHLEQIFS
ncbi:DinB family protein [Cytobacillus sp. IB215665]|uniref:DinB family protein n=1 Tax=Cytobacillus sp. IB215665 TaxID=3097357 RepID=UPI002A17EEAE|nr:DinB family protein [Cytobacillus sp. IB215665]MDX8366174.1 DinB family protein [Cytobacillus sp. IB215665]